MSGFRFRIVPFVVTVVLVSIGLSLAQWQTRRGDEKQAIADLMSVRQSAPVLNLAQASMDIDELEFRHVRVRGEFIADWPMYLDNRPQAGRAGFYLLMPFRLAGSQQEVLVMRGWLPRDVTDRSRVPKPVTPVGEIAIEGVVRRNAGRVMELGQGDAVRPGAIVQNLEPVELATVRQRAMLPFVLEQTSTMEDGLIRDWPLPSAGVDKHRGYAFQWYGLAAMATIFFVVTGFRRGRKSEHK